MTNKSLIAEGNVEGNLKSAKQHYYINLIHKELVNGIMLSDKIELGIMAPSTDGSKEPVYRSLRFDDPSQLYLFVVDLLKAWSIHKFRMDELSEHNYLYYKAKLERDFEKLMVKVLRREE